MAKLDAMREVRGGVVYDAARVNPVTARGWTKTVGLDLGTPRRSGHPRYDIVDAVILLLMKHLTWNVGIEAATAALVANLVRPDLPEVIEAVAVEHERVTLWRMEGYPYLALRLTKPFDQGRHWLVRTAAELEAALAAGGTSLVLICLQALVSNAVRGMQRALTSQTQASA